TGAFISSFVLQAKFGLDQGFDTYDDALPDKRTIFGNLSERRADETTARAARWLAAQGDKPFFLFLHYYDAHAAYEPPEPYASRFADDLYTGEIAYVDANVGRLIEQLKKSGLYDSTLIVVTADHGEMLGEHGEEAHSYFVYNAALHVPLIVHLPGERGARRSGDVVGLVDVAPTIAHLAGVDMSAVDGRDLAPALRSRPTGRDDNSQPGSAAPDDRAIYSESYTPAIYAANPLHALVTGRWKYILANRPELYDWAADPAEANNLIDAEPEMAGELRSRLLELLDSAPAAGGGVDAAVMDAADRRQLEALGYVAVEHDRVGGIDPERSDAKDRIGFHENVKRLAVLVAKRDFGAAERLIAQLLEIWPGFERGYVIRARIALDRGDPAAAEEDIDKALTLDPDDADALSLLGDVRMAGGAVGDAVAEYRAALGRDGDSTKAQVGLGIALAAQDALDEAIEHFREALVIDPGMAEAHHNLALALARKGQTDAAIGEYRAAEQLAPRMVGVQVGLGLALESQGKLAEAAACFRRALELAPGRADVHQNLASLLARRGRYAEAVADYEAALRINPDYAQAHNNLGAVLVRMGRPAEAVEHFERAVALAPDWLEPLNSAAWILATCPQSDVREPAAAVRYAEHAAVVSRRANASILDTLAAAYAAGGDFPRAVATGREALDRAVAARAADEAREIRSRLALYQQERAYVAPAVPGPTP
ncbi:MAG TPA: tetratricopeptide repeat protein, partial [Phycisphaerae bacterium]|nr:tetratricopeptide repeat protein [Phycisphaerae bacterium]